MLPDGRVMYCHDTLDPVIVDPVTNERFQAPESPRLQGCHAVALMPDGRLLYVGGADQPFYGPGTRQVKIFDPEVMLWSFSPELNDFRWYPTMAPLPGGGFVTLGGGGANNPIRVNTSETLDLTTMEWTPAGNVAIGNEVSPVITLFIGQILMTHRPPQLYDPGSRTWSLSGDFVQADRMANGDHADHELVMLADGRVLAIGFLSFTGNPGEMTEIYDPDLDSWDLRANVAPVRSRASVLQTPDQRILVMGGKKEDLADPTPVNAWGQVALTDAYDPATDSWRRLDDMTMAREYHAMPILLPDARVLISAGEGSREVSPSRASSRCSSRRTCSAVLAPRSRRSARRSWNADRPSPSASPTPRPPRVSCWWGPKQPPISWTPVPDGSSSFRSSSKAMSWRSRSLPPRPSPSPAGTSSSSWSTTSPPSGGSSRSTPSHGRSLPCASSPGGRPSRCLRGGASRCRSPRRNRASA